MKAGHSQQSKNGLRKPSKNASKAMFIIIVSVYCLENVKKNIQ